MPDLTVFIDADACPVKDETFRVALRHGVPVVVVSNAYMRLPQDPLISRVVVSDGFDAAEDHIAEQADTNSVVITADIPLADRCLKAGAVVIAPNGKPFTPDMIGGALATRAIMQDLRAGAVGENIGGPPPFSKADRSRFLSTLHDTLERMKRD